MSPKVRKKLYIDNSNGEDSWKANSDDTSEQQDDENTINSNKTSTTRKKDSNKVVTPLFVRYQMLVLLDSENLEAITEETSDDKKSQLNNLEIISLNL